MIRYVATFSLSQARELTSRFPERHPFAGMRRAWVGFDTDSGDRSPLRSVFDGPNCVVRCADWDADSGTRQWFPPNVSELTPSAEHARAIVKLVRWLLDDSREFALCVHCHAGLYRSGAVAHWLSRDLGVEEHDESNRVKACGNMDPTYNATLLRLLREAYAEKGGA